MIATTNTMPTNNRHCRSCTCTCLGGGCDYWHVESDEESQITYITYANDNTNQYMMKIINKKL